MQLTFDANTKHHSGISLHLNNKQVVGAGGCGFYLFVNVDVQETNTLVVQWDCNTVVDTHLDIHSICLNDQKLNINKSWYLPNDKPAGHTDYQMLHGGHLVWPGRLKLNFLVTNPELAYNNIRRKHLSSDMIKMYSVMYD